MQISHGAINHHNRLQRSAPTDLLTLLKRERVAGSLVQRFRFASIIDHGTSQIIQLLHPGTLGSAIAADKLVVVVTWLRRRNKAIGRAVHIQRRIAEQWLLLINHRRINAVLKYFSLAGMSRYRQQAVRRDHLCHLQFGWLPSGVNGQPLGRLLLRLRLIEGK